MSQPCYPRRNELPSEPARSPRRKLVGLSLLAAVALAPKCGAMPYTSYPVDAYRYDQASSQDVGADTGQSRTEDVVVDSRQDLYTPDVEDLNVDGRVDADVVADVDGGAVADGVSEAPDQKAR